METNKHDDLSRIMALQGQQYYMAGRYAMLSMFALVAGLLWHHAVERILKSEVIKSRPDLEGKDLDKYMKDTYGHKLMKLWKAVKELHPSCFLEEFDGVVAEVDGFEGVRYPNLEELTMIQLSVTMIDGPLFQKVSPGGKPMKTVAMSLEEMDALMFKLCHVFRFSPQAFFGFDHESRPMVQTAYFLENRYPLFTPSVDIAFSNVSFLPPRPPVD